MMDKIAIFCSASENIEPVFFEKARELGVWMGQNKKTLVYGGANIGLMECIAKAAKGQRFDDNGSYSDQAGRTWTSQRFGGCDFPYG